MWVVGRDLRLFPQCREAAALLRTVRRWFGSLLALWMPHRVWWAQLAATP